MNEQPHWRRLLLRTEESATAYEQAIAERTGNEECPLCLFETVIKEYEHWTLAANKFPYDRYFSKSDMLVTKTHKTEEELTPEEIAEFKELKVRLSDEYDSLFDHLPKQKSIPGHHHVHIVKIKRPDGV